jgi:hypothetical protein
MLMQGPTKYLWLCLLSLKGAICLLFGLPQKCLSTSVQGYCLHYFILDITCTLHATHPQILQGPLQDQTLACYIWAKNLSTFCLFPEIFWEAEFKGDGLMNLSGEVLRQPSIRAMTWALMEAFNQIYNENLEKNQTIRILKRRVWPESEWKL